MRSTSMNYWPCPLPFSLSDQTEVCLRLWGRPVSQCPKCVSVPDPWKAEFRGNRGQKKWRVEIYGMIYTYIDLLIHSNKFLWIFKMLGRIWTLFEPCRKIRKILKKLAWPHVVLFVLFVEIIAKLSLSSSFSLPNMTIWAESEISDIWHI